VVSGGTTIQKFSDDIHECNQFADEFRRNADETDDPSRKQHYLDMEARGAIWPAMLLS
jgi:hypothetical protein